MLGTAIQQTFFSHSAATRRPTARQKLLGKPFPLPASGEVKAGENKDGTSLLLMLAAHCQFCERSAPFYRRLSEMRAKGARFSLIAVFPEGQAGAESYLSGHEIRTDRIFSLNFPEKGIQGTPTLLLVNRGAIQDVWEGLLDPPREAEVVAHLNSACVNCLAGLVGAPGENGAAAALRSVH
jgi:hypothetical protein